MKRATGNILLLILTAAVSGITLGQSQQQPRNLIFNGPGIILKFPVATGDVTTADTAEPAVASRPSNSSALSQEFMKAGIEEVARLREWATTLASAIRGGYGVTDEWVNTYRDQASQSLQL